MRTVILHYHLFKNAGTSLDAAFKENFKGDEWVTKEFPAQPNKNREQVRQWIIDNPQAKCFSSHTAVLPAPEIEGVKVIPVIFVRHPIDRIASAYSFEKKQGGDTFGAVLARNTDLSGYIETRLSLSYDRQCRNFHVDRLSTMFPPNTGTELERAVRAIEELPFVGIVERFSESLIKLESLLAECGFVNISLKAKEENVSRKVNSDIEEKINIIESTVDNDIYNKLIVSNQDDMSIYQKMLGEK